MSKTSDERFESRTSARCRAGVVGALLIGLALMGGVAGSAEAAGYKVDVGGLANQHGDDPSECPVDATASTPFPALNPAFDCLGEEGGCGEPNTCGGEAAPSTCTERVDLSFPALDEGWDDEDGEPQEPDVGANDTHLCVAPADKTCMAADAFIVRGGKDGESVDTGEAQAFDIACDATQVPGSNQFRVSAFLQFHYDEGDSSKKEQWSFRMTVDCPVDYLDADTGRQIFKDQRGNHDASLGKLYVSWSAERIQRGTITCGTQVEAWLERDNCGPCGMDIVLYFRDSGTITFVKLV